MWRVNSVHTERGFLTITEVSKFYLFAWKNGFGKAKSQTATLKRKKKKKNSTFQRVEKH